MLTNNFKIALRNFSRNKVYGSINLSGLVIGMASFLIITLYIFQELSYDRFHKDVATKYRIQMNRYDGNEPLFESAVTFPAVGPALARDIPEVQEFVRILPFGTGVFRYESTNGTLKSFNENSSVFADKNFFTFFNFKLVSGNPEQVLSEKMQVVISESTAHKYFGDQEAIGKILAWRGESDFVVSGVMADMPVNSHMNFDIIMSLGSWDGFEEFPEIWGWYDFYTFVKLDPNANPVAFDDKMEDFMKKYKGDQYLESGRWETLFLQPVTDIHLYSNLSWDMGYNGGGDMIYFLVAIACLILIIAWVNYINLATARAIKRAREVGVRKSIGAQKHQLILQFLTEAFVFNFIAISVAVGFTLLIIPWFNQVNNLTISSGILFSAPILPGLAILLLIGTIISGLYPAFVLTSFSPTTVLKGTVSVRSGNMAFRKLLVLFQFAATVVLIVCTFTVLKQMKFMKSQDLGIEIAKNLILISPTSIPDREVMISKIGFLRNHLLSYQNITGFSMSTSITGTENFGIGPLATRSKPGAFQDIYRSRIDHDFMSNYKIEFIAGRNFSKDFPGDTGAVILNEIAIKQLQIENPEMALQEKIVTGNREWNIVGVIKSYHDASLREELDPMVFYLTRSWGRFLSVKLNSNDASNTLGFVKEQWKKAFADAPMEYYFLDDHYNRVYEADDRFNNLFMAFTGLAIFVACLGLFGLVSFTAEQSAKTISIRKVLGSSINSIVFHLTKEYLVLIGFASLLAFPIAYYLMDQWLEEFAYRTSLGAGIFVVTAILITFIAVFTVSFQSIKAAKANPAEVLRNE